MSSYVDSVLAQGEQIVYRAAISHWKFFLSYLIGGLVMILSAIIRRQTTELVLTSRRIITKRGLVSRDTVEMNLSKVESLHVNQGLMGRLLNYGDVTVVGTGASLEPLRGIARPLEVRKQLGGVVESSVPKSKP